MAYKRTRKILYYQIAPELGQQSIPIRLFVTAAEGPQNTSSDIFDVIIVTAEKTKLGLPGKQIALISEISENNIQHADSLPVPMVNYDMGNRRQEKNSHHRKPKSRKEQRPTSRKLCEQTD